MADFVGSYYAPNESVGTDDEQFDPLYAETPVSIVDMERLEVRSRAQGRIRQVDSLRTSTLTTEYGKENEAKSSKAGRSQESDRTGVSQTNNNVSDVFIMEQDDEDEEDMEIPVASMNFQDGTVPSLATVPLSTIVPLPSAEKAKELEQAYRPDDSSKSVVSNTSDVECDRMPYGDWGWRDSAKEISADSDTVGVQGKGDSSSIPMLLKSPAVSPSGDAQQEAPEKSGETQQGRFATVINLKRSIVRFFSRKER